MNAWQRIVAAYLAAATAAAVYFKLGAWSSRELSHYALDYPIMIALLSLPGPILITTIRGWTAWRLIAGFAGSVAIAIYILLIGLFAGMPGTESIPIGMANILLALPVVCSAFLLVFQRQAKYAFCVCAAVSLLATIVTVRATTLSAIGRQISATAQNGGCAFAARGGIYEQINSTQGVTLGLLVGSRSQRVYFFEGGKTYKYSYSQIGLESRRGVPVPSDRVTLPACH